MSSVSIPPSGPREDAQKAHDVENAFWTQTNQAAIDSGAAAVKTFFLLNGGAAIALLAFVGALAGSGRIGGGDLKMLAGTLQWFTQGVAFAAGSAGAAYLTNYYTAAMSSSKTRNLEWPYLGPPAKHWLVLRVLFLIIAVVCGLASLGTFVGGMYEVKSSLSVIKILDKPDQR